ncbi:MAG: alpha/beta hydrolase [Puniceicoccaceae bacterium]|nr:MAG: alpha/beta hydrolase [Puniceicoccaceae bacterium]
MDTSPSETSAGLPTVDPAEVRLWPGTAPGAKGEGPEDIPTVTPFLVRSDSGPRPAMVICPGGGYGMLAPHEGADYARFLNRHGFSAFVLRYRLGSAGYRHPCMWRDACRAIRMVRARAAEWGVDSARVAVMGSSAGGHLAAHVATVNDGGDPSAADPVERFSSRPDLAILCYPVIAMAEPFGHTGSRKNLLGDDPDEELAAEVSPDRRVSPETPPTFLWHTVEDPVVPVRNALAFADALARAEIPFELHLYERGRHGLGLDVPAPFEAPHPWAAAMLRWLSERGWETIAD